MPLSRASGPSSAPVATDKGSTQPLTRSTTVRPRSDLILTAHRERASSPAAYKWHFALSAKESLTKLADGRIAVVAPWPPNEGDGTDYSSPDGTPGERVTSGPPPLPASDPYRYSADPDGSMAAEEALHDVGPFDPAYADEYLPDPSSDAAEEPDAPTDGLVPSDEPVPEMDPLDAIYAAELSRDDQIVALIDSPQATDALGRRVVVRLRITGPDTVEVRFRPSSTAAFPLTATARLTFNPDALS
jgi:hypothetical protein